MPAAFNENAPVLRTDGSLFGGRRIGAVLGFSAVVLTALCIAFVDRRAATWTHEQFHGVAVFVWLTHIVDPILPASALGFLGIGLGLLAGWRPGPIARAVFVACIAVLLAIIIKDQLKYAFGRLWPETWVNNNPSWIGGGAYAFVPFHGGTGWSSFPSGHMTVITAPMVVLARVLGRWRWLTLVPVLLVAIGLYGADYHFVGDIVAGTLTGAVCATIVLTFGGLTAWPLAHGALEIAAQPEPNMVARDDTERFARSL